MVFKNPYWTNTTKIELLQGWIIVHSILYYEHDISIVADNVYDMNEVQLSEMMKKYPKSAKRSKYAYAFKGFDGSTGYDIPGKLSKQDRKKFNDIIDFILKTEEKKL